MFLGMRRKLCDFKSWYLRDRRGTVAIEFAFVIIPFLMLLFMQIAVSLYYFTTFSLEYSIEQAARAIRTGEAQQAGVTQGDFKSTICGLAPGFMDCDNNLRVNVVEFTDFASVSLPQCLDDAGALVPDPPEDDSVPGEALGTVLVIACYEWTLVRNLPFINDRLGNMSNGSLLIRAVTVFEAEPYQ
ncbi:MAG: TadE/TadG family type IV pilus assembly protein [Pseudomonadota bacterium]